MDYLHALYYSPRRENPDELRKRLVTLDDSLRREENAKRRLRLSRRTESLRRRLRVAEAFVGYDWRRGEDEFIREVRNAIDKPGVFERWRAHGVPLRVLREAQRNASRAG